MKKSLMFVLVLSFMVNGVVYSRSIEDIRKELDMEKDDEVKKKEEEQGLIDIQRIYKDRINDYIWKTGQGVRSVLAITVQFIIRQRGNNFRMSKLKVYLFDRQKNRIGSINEFFYLTSTGSEEGTINDAFRGFKTYRLQFPYKIEQKFRYVVAVIGNEQNCSYAILPEATSLDGFYFPEKDIINKK